MMKSLMKFFTLAPVKNISMDLSQCLLLLLLLILSSLHTARSIIYNNLDADLESLLAFKEQVIDPSGILAANWTVKTSFCSWTGIICSSGRQQRVTVLDLYSLSLGGTISPHLANLSSIYKLNLGNNSLTGSIPKELGQLPELQWINLESNYLTGTIPTGFFNMSSLLGIYLGRNNLTGSLPSLNNSLTLPPQLQNISLGYNQLTGKIPSFASYWNLHVLSLTRNLFSGTIPVELGNLPKLRLLYLTKNQLTGMIPASFGNLTELQELEISFNHLEGRIPEELGNLQRLQELHLAKNRLTGSIPISIFNASNLQIVELSGNNLSGSIPATVGNSVPLLTVLLLSVNQLTGAFDFITSLSNSRNLLALDVAANELDGSLPDSVANLSAKLQHFNTGENSIGGIIPAGLGNLSSLYLLDVAMNKLTGPVPPALTKLQKMEVFYLAGNQITGSIPFEIGQMTSMIDVNLEVNFLSGHIPDSISNLTGLQHLSLSSNMLSSNIPMGLWSLTNLIDLFLEINILNGSVPPQVGSLKVLDAMDLSKNHLSGYISAAFGQLQMLTYLDLSSNSFQGEIEESFGNLINIEYLNLSHNSLTGDIPESLSNLHYLNTLDLSFNKLEGKIPEGRVFSNLSITSLSGNAALCGAPRLNFSPCSAVPSSSVPRSRLHLIVYILPAIASFVVIFACLYLLLRFRNKTRAKLPTTATDILTEYTLISYHELVRATDNFSTANLLGKGGSGSVFRACLDNGLVTAVKVLNFEVQGAIKSFDAECEVLRTVRHRNLVKIISTCSNLDFKALIFEFMVNGSLEKWLYSDKCYLTLLQRLNIMVDVASALEYLHHHHGNIVLHRDLKPSNVLLDENMIAHLGDFGIAKMLLGDCVSGVLTNSAATFGYMAPECAYAGKISRMSDVYSFGILLLETLTGKKPTDAMFEEELNLRQWVNNAYPSVPEIVDRNLLGDDSTQTDQAEVLTVIHQCVTSIIELALLCSVDSPKERITMQEVGPRLQDIRKSYLSSMPPSISTINP